MWSSFENRLEDPNNQREREWQEVDSQTHKKIEKIFWKASKNEDKQNYKKAIDFYKETIQEKINTQYMSEHFRMEVYNEVAYCLDRMTVLLNKEKRFEESLEALEFYYSSEFPKKNFKKSPTLEKRLISIRKKLGKDVSLLWPKEYGCECNPYWKVEVEVPFSRSGMYQQVKDLMESWPSKTILDSSNSSPTYKLVFDSSQTKQLDYLLKFVSNWKDVRYYYEESAYDSASGLRKVLKCYTNFSHDNERDEIGYCYGMDQRAYNIWGCKKFRDLSECEIETFHWWLLYERKGQGLYEIDFEELKKRAEELFDKHKFCPLLNKKKMENALEAVPRTIDVTREIIWTEENGTLKVETLGKFLRVWMFDEGDLFPMQLTPIYIELTGFLSGLTFKENVIRICEKNLPSSQPLEMVWIQSVYSGPIDMSKVREIIIRKIKEALERAKKNNTEEDELKLNISPIMLLNS